MKFETEIKQWGNSLALRISGAMAKEPMFAKGVAVIVETSENQMIIKPKAEPMHFQLPFTESELLIGLDDTVLKNVEIAELNDEEWNV